VKPKIRVIPITELVLDDKNANKGTKRGGALLGESLEKYGSSLVAVQRGDLDLTKDKKARELALADNRVSEIDLDWNPEVLASLDVDLSQFWNEKRTQFPA
jgi:hypothetical protein